MNFKNSRQNSELVFEIRHFWNYSRSVYIFSFAYSRSGVTSGFHGCIKNLTIDNVSIDFNISLLDEQSQSITPCTHNYKGKVDQTQF